MHLASSLDDFMINYENKCQTFEFFSLDQTGPPFFFFFLLYPLQMSHVQNSAS